MRSSPVATTAAGTPALCSASAVSAASRVRVQSARASSIRSSATLRAARERPASPAPVSRARARHCSSSSTAIATHRSWPRAGYTPCGARCATRCGWLGVAPVGSAPSCCSRTAGPIAAAIASSWDRSTNPPRPSASIARTASTAVLAATMSPRPKVRPCGSPPGSALSWVSPDIAASVSAKVTALRHGPVCPVPDIDTAIRSGLPSEAWSRPHLAIVPGL